MATRYRIIQYDGPDEAVERIISRSINGTFPDAWGNRGVTISAWEARSGDSVETRAGLPQWRPAVSTHGDKPNVDPSAA